MAATLVSINVGLPRAVEWQGRTVSSAIWKLPVEGSVRVAGVNVVGDDQADRRVHGGNDKAVYAYAAEDYAWWTDAHGVDVGPGFFGDNLTTQGLDVTGSAVGDHWRIGAVLLEVAQPREPCFKLGMRMGDEHFPGKFEQARRPGTYLRILEEGEVAAGDAITIRETHEPRITVGDLTGELSADTWRVIAADARFPEGWRRRAERALR